MDIQLYNRRGYVRGGRYASRNRALVLEVLGSVLTIVFESTQLNLGVRTSPPTALTLKNSDGSQDIFNTNITKNYPDSARRSVSLDTNRNAIDLIEVRSPGTVSLNGPVGTADFTAFPNLVAASCVNSYCNTFKINTIYAFDISRAQCVGKVLDLSAARASSIRAIGTNCKDINWPVLGTQAVIASQHAITTAQVVPYVPGLNEIYLEQNQAASAAGIGLLDISQNPQVQALLLRQSRVNNLRTAPANDLANLDIIYTDFSQDYPDQPANPISVAETLQNSPKLNQVTGYNCGLDADSLEALLDVILATRPRNLLLGGGSSGYHFLNSGGVNGRACEPLVTASAQAKLAQVRAAGCYVEINDAVFKTTVLTETEARIELVNSTRPITWWGIGDVLDCPQPFNSDLFNVGSHTVLSGSGTSWVVTNTKQYPGNFIGASGLSILTKA